MKILLVSNEGAGETAWKDIEGGTTVGQMISQFVGSGDYLIRVNREQANNDYVLKNEDRVTVTPTNIEGA